MFDSPITLTEEAVYFARAAALIEGIGTRYDPYFQIVPVASPVVLRMRTKILRSLGETVSPNAEEIATVAGYALGRAARWVTDRVKRPWFDRAKEVSVFVFAALTLSACARGPAGIVYVPAPAPVGPRVVDVRCDSCAPVAMKPEVARAIETRIADLKTRGGTCLAYGEVLQRSYVEGRITLRPYMWRVGGNLASGQARESGELATAVEIDSLNVGRRTLDEVIRSIEHEAAHVALQIPSRDDSAEKAVDLRVKECR
jgi:hypothetical protein